MPNYSMMMMFVMMMMMRVIMTMTAAAAIVEYSYVFGRLLRKEEGRPMI